MRLCCQCGFEVGDVVQLRVFLSLCTKILRFCCVFCTLQLCWGYGLLCLLGVVIFAVGEKFEVWVLGKVIFAVGLVSRGCQVDVLYSVK